MQWHGESGVIAEAKRDGWDRLSEVLDSEVEVRRSGNLQEIELDVMDPESGTEWNFVRDEDAQWWGCDRRGSWHTSYGEDVSHAVAAIAEQLADLKKKQAAELASDADDLRLVAHELRAAEEAAADTAEKGMWLCRECFNEPANPYDPLTGPADADEWYPSGARRRTCGECSVETNCIPTGATT